MHSRSYGELCYSRQRASAAREPSGGRGASKDGLGRPDVCDAIGSRFGAVKAARRRARDVGRDDPGPVHPRLRRPRFNCELELDNAWSTAGREAVLAAAGTASRGVAATADARGLGPGDLCAAAAAAQHCGVAAAAAIAAATAARRVGLGAVSVDRHATWDDVAGLVRAKEVVRRAIVWPRTMAAEMRRLGITAPAGVLLHG